MRIYFLSAAKAVLKLNGLYVGTVDGYERHIDLELSQSLLAEVVPVDGLLPVSFFIDENLLFSPPDFLEVYLSDGETVIYLKEFREANRLAVILQEEFYNNLITIFSLGGAYLSLDGKGTSLTPIPTEFIKPEAKIEIVDGAEIAAIKADDNLLLITQTGKHMLFTKVRNFEFGEQMKITIALETCTNAEKVQFFGYDGDELNLISSQINELMPDENLLHFAFFECLLCGGDYKKYLSAELLPKSDELKSYLGNFISVTVPTSFFFLKHGDLPAVGLVYLKIGNLFEIKYYAVDILNGKIDNIYPVE